MKKPKLRVSFAFFFGCFLFTNLMVIYIKILCNRKSIREKLFRLWGTIKDKKIWYLIKFKGKLKLPNFFLNKLNDNYYCYDVKMKRWEKFQKINFHNIGMQLGMWIKLEVNIILYNIYGNHKIARACEG